MTLRARPCCRRRQPLPPRTACRRPPPSWQRCWAPATRWQRWVGALLWLRGTGCGRGEAARCRAVQGCLRRPAPAHRAVHLPTAAVRRSCCGWQMPTCRRRRGRRRQSASVEQPLSWLPSSWASCWLLRRDGGPGLGWTRLAGSRPTRAGGCRCPPPCSCGCRRTRASPPHLRPAPAPQPPAEEEWPDAKEIKAARRAEEEAKTPVPERCWALRNVAGAAGAGRLGLAVGRNRDVVLLWQTCKTGVWFTRLAAAFAPCHPPLAGTLSMGGPGERARARQLLEQAVLLKQGFAGAKDHPGAGRAAGRRGRAGGGSGWRRLW